MEYISLQFFIWSMGILISSVGVIIGYWIKEIKGLEKSFDRHKVENDKRFDNHQRENDKHFSDIRIDLNTKTDNLAKDIAEIKVSLKYILEVLKELKDR